MRLAAEPFSAIKKGRKVIESRLYDEKRQIIQIGDVIEFSENENRDSTVRVKVIGLLRYQTFATLFADHDPMLFGGTDAHMLLEQIKEFYSDEDEAAFGVIGIRFML